MSNKKAESLARAVDAAIQAFSSMDYDDVMIADIAAQARCSTATLYDAFGTKQRLYEHVRQRLFQERPRQGPIEEPGETAGLPYLLDYLFEVFRALTNPAIAILTSPAEANEPTGYRPLEHSGLDFDAIRIAVSRCMDSGLLRPADPYDVTFLMFAGISYEPLLYNFMCRESACLDGAAIVRSIFTPLITPIGAKALETYLSDHASQTRPAATEASVTFHELMHLGSLADERKAAVHATLAQMRRWSRECRAQRL